MIENIDKSRLRWSIGTDRRGLSECFYKIQIPSVSSILSECVPDPDLEEFIKSVGEERAKIIMEAAAQRGTSMHTFIEQFMDVFSKNNDPSEALLETQKKSPALLIQQDIPENKIKEGLDMFYKYYHSEYPVKYKDVIGLEKPIHSEQYYFRGLADIVYKIAGCAAVTDFKTASSYIKKGTIKEKKYKLQLGAYSLALDEMLLLEGYSINEAHILCVNTKSEGLQDIGCSYNELNALKDEFKELSKMWHTNHGQAFLFN